MEKPFLLIPALIIFLVLASGCTQAPPGQQNQSQNASQYPDYVRMCLDSCNNTLKAGDTAALELGYCLLDRIPLEPDWCCDVAHDPRQEVDDSPNNQCQSYLRGETHHFVEVSPECVLIRAV